MTDRRSAEAPPGEPEAEDDEKLDEQGRESFPASDPPSNWAGED